MINECAKSSNSCNQIYIHKLLQNKTKYMYTNFNKTKSRVGLMIWAKAKDKKRQSKKKKRKDRANDQVLFYSEGSRKLSK